MLEDKIKATDWEATNEAIEEQVARESYLQWLRDNEMRKAVSIFYIFSRKKGKENVFLHVPVLLFFKRSASSSSSSALTSTQHSHALFHSHGSRAQQRSHTSSPTGTAAPADSLRNSPKVCTKQTRFLQFLGNSFFF